MPIRRATVHAQPGTDRWTYDIEADWILMTTCNYRCAYCFFDAEALGRKIAPPADTSQLASFFDTTGLTWLLHLTGGEPFHYPDFAELCALLTRRHIISINTNADSQRVKTFAEVVDPARVHYLNCGLHIQQRTERNREEQFVNNVLTLRSHGFNAFVSCVMDPDIFAVFPQLWESYAERGLFIIPKALKGRHKGRSFPAEYTNDERSLFVEFSRRAEVAYREQFAHQVEAPTVNPLADRDLCLDGFADFRGQLCEAGHRFVRILPNGQIRRCGPVDVLGNVVEGRFERRLGPSICREVACHYFCEKYRVRGATPLRSVAVAQ